jgi:hypothetical protein
VGYALAQATLTMRCASNGSWFGVGLNASAMARRSFLLSIRFMFCFSLTGEKQRFRPIFPCCLVTAALHRCNIGRYNSHRIIRARPALATMTIVRTVLDCKGNRLFVLLFSAGIPRLHTERRTRVACVCGGPLGQPYLTDYATGRSLDHVV